MIRGLPQWRHWVAVFPDASANNSKLLLHSSQRYSKIGIPTYTENELPQPHDFTAFGFSSLNPPPIMLST